MRPVVIIVEDHPLVAQGFAALLRGKYTVPDVVLDSRNVPTALDTHKPDLVLLDLSMPRRNGLELLPEIKQRLPEVKVLVVSMHVDRGLVELALKAGANGFVTKEAQAEEFRGAVEAVLRGERYISPGVGKKANVDDEALDSPMLERLTRRQRQVLHYIGAGMTTAEIGEILGVSTRTVDWHRGELKKALGVANEWELVRFAVAAGLMPRKLKSVRDQAAQ